MQPLENEMQDGEDIIRNGADRNNLDGLLQFQLQTEPIVHFAQKILVLTFELDVDAGSQELCGAGQLAGKIFLAFLGRGAGTDRRCESAG